MEKYFEIETSKGKIYYQAPHFMFNRYFKNYATSAKMRPKIKFLLDYYGYNNITIIETEEKKPTKNYPPQVNVKLIREGQVISYNIVSKEIEIVLDETKKTFVNRYCLEGVKLYFTKDVYYNNPKTKEAIEQITKIYIEDFLSKKEALTYSQISINLDEDGNPYLMAKLTKN